jgi:hypothetical protein
VSGDAAVFVIDKNSTLAVYDFYALAYVFKWHAVIVFVLTQIDVTVFMNGS